MNFSNINIFQKDISKIILIVLLIFNNKKKANEIKRCNIDITKKLFKNPIQNLLD